MYGETLTTDFGDDKQAEEGRFLTDHRIDCTTLIHARETTLCDLRRAIASKHRICVFLIINRVAALIEPMKNEFDCETN